MLRPKNLIGAVAVLIVAISGIFIQPFLLGDKEAMAGNFLIRKEKTAKAQNISISEDNYLLPKAKPPIFERSDVKEVLLVFATAYSSSIAETDSDPFITASGKRVRDGIIANNLLPFGTKVRLPGLFGDKVFVVEDRMNKRKSNYQIDIWFSSRREALNFGSKVTRMEILK